ncbi:unnamed protein product [Onchocerca flexuosa]|uniref:Uncharacterized protein n=1 Tax=Onchocerca flexuosa TaxID=387005 RepID=A0A183HI22_9BILA|nr:unnamed protein product [Onchocerca flexuosa]
MNRPSRRDALLIIIVEYIIAYSVVGGIICPLSSPVFFILLLLAHYFLSLIINQPNQLQQGLLPVYSAANSQLMIAHAARKAGLIKVAIDRISRIHTLSALPAMDAYFSLRELLKCLMQRAFMPNLTEEQKHSALMEAFAVVQKTSINTFTKENIAKLYSLRGKILAELEK